MVTGCAEFIESHLTDRPLDDGHDVVGIDSFEDYYPRAIKEANIAAAPADPAFKLIEQNLLDANIAVILRGIACVCHLAAQAGLRASWKSSFAICTPNNAHDY